MKNIYFFIILIIFNSCGNESSKNEELIINKEEPLIYQQWSINYNQEFYSENNINNNANINTMDILDKYTGKGIKVAIIDNGFDISHPEIKDNIIATISVDENGNISNDVGHDNNYEYHGTAVAGIIAANINNKGIRGISPNVELILIKMPKIINDSTEIELFKQAVKYNADIINCSWGTYDVSETVKDYINDISTNARNGKGVIIVFSSGNDNKDMGNDESSIKNIIGVGATNKDNLRTVYSNYGKDLDIVAPGGNLLGITTIDPLGNNGTSNDDYNRYNELKDGSKTSFIGTSASAPIITATLALALEKNKNISRKDIQYILKYSTSYIGENVPYLDDIILSSSPTPIISGILGNLNNDNIQVKLVSEATLTEYGPYSILVNNNKFTSLITDQIEEGNYTVNILDESSKVILATKEHFIIDYNGITYTNSDIKFNNFYGFGKIDLNKFIKNIF